VDVAAHELDLLARRADEREVVVRIAVDDLRLPPEMEVLSERDLPEVTLRVRGTRRRLQ
jgi:hypothetical protein